MLEARQLSVALGRSAIVREVDCALDANEVVGLIGPNGSGKSTLLRAMAGLLPAAGGSVLLNGRPIGGMTRGNWRGPWPTCRRGRNATGH